MLAAPPACTPPPGPGLQSGVSDHDQPDAPGRPGPDTPDQQSALARAWLDAIARPDISAALESIYALIADQIEARGPACWASGRCCNFESHGHRLYTTGLEAAYLVARLPQPLTHGAIDQARQRGGCPFQIDNLCGAHAIKPSGCRIYFCDHSAQAWQHDLSERAMGLIRSLHEREGLPYRYAEWRTLLSFFAPDPARR